MDLNLIMRSLIGRTRNLGIALGVHFRSVTSKNPFFLNFSTILLMGAVSLIPPPDDLLLSAAGRERIMRGEASTHFLMFVPKKIALSLRALVINVLGIESSRRSDSRKILMLSFRRDAALLEPQTPTSQSSAYLTYSILVYLGFGFVLICFCLNLHNFFRLLQLGS
jgi:hypothetical protein